MEHHLQFSRALQADQLGIKCCNVYFQWSSFLMIISAEIRGELRIELIIMQAFPALTGFSALPTPHSPNWWLTAPTGRAGMRKSP